MNTTSPITISVSQQFGSGGGLLGNTLAKKLGVAHKEIEPFDERTAQDE